MLRRRTSPHSGANAGAGRSQLRSQAFQASCSASPSNPGNSPQPTGTQRLLDCVSVPGTGTGTVGAAGGCTDGTLGATGAGGRVEHAASVPTISADTTRRRRRRFMGLILLEALLALVLLVGIVWWTMFSGRKGGEPPAAPSEPPRGDAPPHD